MSADITAPVQRDRIDLSHANAFLAMLGLDHVAEIGTPLPAFAHHAFFRQALAEHDLDASGQGGWGIDLPAEQDLPVRSVAGGVLRCHGALQAGVLAERSTRIANVTRKTGRSGGPTFVTLRHEIKQRAQPVLSEDLTIVLRESGAMPDAQSVTGEADARKALKLSAITLFRYAAVTFDASRVHYDADFAREQGYPGPVVQVPLMATALAAWAEAAGQRIARFSYRAEAPLFLGDVAWICRAGSRYWVEGPKRRLCLTAEIA